MIEAAEDAVTFCRGMSESEFHADARTKRAVIQCIEVIGEASRHLSSEARGELSASPWDAIRGMRNHLAHVYYDVNMDVVWATVSKELPSLISALKTWESQQP